MTPTEKIKRSPSPNGNKASATRNGRARNHRTSEQKNDVQTAASDPAVSVIGSAVEASAPPSLVRDPEPLAFPLDALPDCLTIYCRQLAASLTAPVDFVAVTVLTLAGAGIGNSRALCVKPGWHEGARIYAVIVGDPASGKTPAMRAVLQPYVEIQQRLFHEYRIGLEKYEQALRERETAQPRLVLVGDSLEPTPVPVAPPRPPRLIVDDATVEALAFLLEEKPRGLLMPLDELASWFLRMKRMFWQSVWSGQPILVDRKSQRGEPIAIAQPFINVIGGIQPDLLHLLDDKQGRRDGFRDRILFSFPVTPGAQEWTETPVSEESVATWRDTLLYLHGLEMRSTETGLAPVTVAFSPAAKERWVAWWYMHDAEMRDPDRSVSLRGPWGKLTTYAARLTLVLHYLWLAAGDRVERDVDADTVDRAVALVNFFKSHLRRVHNRLRQSPEEKLHDEVLAWVRRNGGTCTARDLVRARLVAPSKRAWAVLEELVALGHGRFDEFTALNHKTVRRFLLNEEA